MRVLCLVQRKLAIIGTPFAADDNEWMWCVQSQQCTDVGDSPDARRALMPVPVDVIANPVVERRDRTDRHCQFDARIDRGDPVRRVAAARLAGEANPFGIDFRLRRQHVQRADRIENLECGR